MMLSALNFPRKTPYEVDITLLWSVFFLSFVVVVVVAISWAAPAAYGGSQARG